MLDTAARAQRLAAMRPRLDERRWRWLLGSEAVAWGPGGVMAVTRACGAARATVIKGKAEVLAGATPDGRVRRPGGGRPKAERVHPQLPAELEKLVDPATRGDPIKPLRWTTKSLPALARELSTAGMAVSDRTVGRLLHRLGYRLQANAKTKEGASHPDRDAQFRYLNVHVEEYLAAAQPVISIDCKKKELVGQYLNRGREWNPAGTPTEVLSHDFPDPKVPKAVPYGIYDVGANTGWVSVGVDHESATFAVNTLRAWWNEVGRARYPHADRLLITADSGGANGNRRRAWKAELAAFAADSGLQVTVCHMPPGTSKWNRIEHRLFSFISINWRARPLTSYQVIIELIGTTTTNTGLTVEARLDERAYPLGQDVTKQQIDLIPLTAHEFHGEWNYTIEPESP